MRCAPLLVVLALSACRPADKGTGTGTPPPNFCPGAPGCEGGNDGRFTAGFAVRATSPTGWEQPRPDFLKYSGADCPEGSPVGGDGRPRCGPLVDDAWKDCGRDGLCPAEAGYTAADADGSERDGVVDWFRDCGRDRLCPGDVGYAAPDADGSEGDGKFQGFWMAGFGNNVPMWDVHDDTFARALVLTNGDVSLALVSIDAVGLFNDDVQRIRARVAAKMPAPPDFILISSTHTHEAPDTMGQWGPKPAVVPERGVDDAWLEAVLIESAAQAVVDAAMAARPAKLSVARGRLGARTRETTRDSRDPQVIDDAVTVLRFDEASSGYPLGTLVNWGNHPEVLSDVNNRASSDYVWAVREAMEKGVFDAQGRQLAPGVGGTCLYLQGKVGGLMTPLGVETTSVDGTVAPQRSFAKAKAVGDLVAQVALTALAGAQAVPAPLLAYGQEPLQLPVENETFQFVFLNFGMLKRKLVGFDRTKVVSATNFPKVQSEVSVLHLGPVRILGVPGELFPELGIGFDPGLAFGAPQVDPRNPNPPDLALAPKGPFLEEALGGEFAMVAGLANDEVGYLVPPYDFKLHPDRPWAEQAAGDHYEETNSLGPSTVPAVLEAAARLMAWQPRP
jgi:hypothetical protein